MLHPTARRFCTWCHIVPPTCDLFRPCLVSMWCKKMECAKTGSIGTDCEQMVVATCCNMFSLLCDPKLVPKKSPAQQLAIKIVLFSVRPTPPPPAQHTATTCSLWYHEILVPQHTEVLYVAWYCDVSLFSRMFCDVSLFSLMRSKHRPWFCDVSLFSLMKSKHRP